MDNALIRSRVPLHQGALEMDGNPLLPQESGSPHRLHERSFHSGHRVVLIRIGAVHADANLHEFEFPQSPSQLGSHQGRVGKNGQGK